MLADPVTEEVLAAGYMAPEADAATTGPAKVRVVDVTASDVETMLVYLQKTLSKAEQIRARTTAGSYLDKVLAKTMESIAVEMAQLRYLLAHPDYPVPPGLAGLFVSGTKAAAGRMQPAM
ncbi:hypothetical protein [Roseibium aggregatum]|uniref:Uncharacterized protein n=1 Tax=Roseibium aggregatum TaxID=187304 RepID=A0A926S8H8_9HYPH|nr:hypothetical protein [Roseibium aggregatum]MBD1548737.1 hypothetical protein [Roseibium aggregatum]